MEGELGGPCRTSIGRLQIFPSWGRFEFLKRTSPVGRAPQEPSGEGIHFTLGWFRSLRTEGREGSEGLKQLIGGENYQTLTAPGTILREILQEIQRLRLEHEQASQPTPEKAQQNPMLLAELRLLR